MKPSQRRILFGLVLAFGLVGLAAIVALALLLDTTTGARWALSWASGAIPGGRLDVRETRGTLSSPLVLRGVEFQMGSVSVSVERLMVRWDLSDLLRRELAIRVLEADTVRLALRPSSEPAVETPGPPKLPDLRLPIAVRLGELRVRDFLYASPGDSGGFALDEARLGGEFRGDRVRISSLRARSRLFDVDAHGQVRPRREYPLDFELDGALRLPERPELRGHARVDGSLDRARVALRLDAPFSAKVATTVSEVLETPRFDGQVEFSRFDPHEWAAASPSLGADGRIAARGTISHFEASGRVSIRTDSLGTVDAEGAIALLGDSLRVDRLSLARPGRGERVNAQGLIAGLGETPRVELAADWKGLVWPLEGDTLVRSEQGRLRLAGTPARYTLDLEGALESPHAELGRWRIEATGDTTHLEVARLDGALLGGRVLGGGRLDWKPRVSWTATLHGDSLDPSRYSTDWPGRVGLDLETRGEVRDTVVDLEARVTGLAGTLRSLPLSGQGSVAMNGRAWSAHDVQVAWGDARLTGAGSSGESWDLAAAIRVPNLGPFLPGAAGALRADLKLTGTRAEPRLVIDARGDSLGMGASQVGTVTLAMDAGLRPTDPVTIVLDAGRVRVNGSAIDTLTVRGEGDAAHHKVRASVRGRGDTLSIASNGSFEHEHWQGRLDEFELRTRQTGTWRLEAPAAAGASVREARLDSFCVRSGERSIRANLDWRAGAALNAHAALTAVPLGLIDPWLPNGANLLGSIDGTIEARAERPEGPLLAQVRLTQSPAQFIYSLTTTERDTVRLGEGRLSVDSDAEGARGSLSLHWESGDHLEAEVGLPGFNALRPDTLHQRLTGRIRSQASDLAVLSAYVPGLDHMRGDLTADLQLSGTLHRPEVDGQVQLKDGRAAIPALSVALEDANLAIHFDTGHRMTLEGSIRSGKGRIALTGAAEVERLEFPTVKIGIKGKDFTVADTRQAKVAVSPDLQIELQRSRIDVSGQVDVPFARLVSLEKATQFAVAPSSDVVMKGQQTDSTTAGPKIYSRVRVVIGDDVEVRVPSFRGRPEGSILTIDEPGEVTRASGELKVTEGIYRAYGQDLKVERGRLIFGGGPISNPGLDLRASRTCTDGTIAGVQITGTAESPILALFSTPAMSQSDALSYIMFGKPVNETGGSSGAAGMAASQLSVGGTDMLARGMAGKFGIQDASVESKGGTMQEASLFIGTYLSPKLYVSYGIGLFESQTTIRMRYQMSKHWWFQTESGTERSGIVQFTAEH